MTTLLEQPKIRTSVRSGQMTTAGSASGATEAKPILRGLRRALKSISSLVAAVAFAGFCFVGVGPHLFGYRTATMLSGSMSPHIKPGDVVLDVPEPLSAVRVGQVLTIETPTATHFVDSHRVVQVIRRQGGVFIRTKGDANPVRDPWTAKLQGKVAWRVVAVVPKLGFVINFVRGRAARLALLGLAPLLFVLVGLNAIWRKADDEGQSLEPAST